MKKFNSIYTLCLLLLVAAVACNKKLDVIPQNSVTPDNIQTSADVQALLGGAYTQLQSYGAFGEQFILIPDLIADSDQINWVGTYPEYRDIQEKRAQTNNYVAGSLWGNSYKIIDIANTVMDKLALVDSSDRSNYKAQALFLRGLVYYELVGLFGKPYSDGNASSNPGVPILLSPVYVYDSLKDKPTRAAVGAVYTQILSDLTQATSLQSGTDLSKTQAFLSRVYLSMGDYQNAFAEADSVISSGNYQLNTTYDKAFNNAAASVEDIFYIDQNVQSNAGTGSQGLTTFYAPNFGQPSNLPAGRGDAQIDNTYFDYFSTEDFRAAYVDSGYSISGFFGYYPAKWAQFYKVIPVVRLAEMYLTRGEAYAARGNIEDALNDINVVRERAGAKDLTTVSVQDFADERFRELGFEGDRMWTLKRLKMPFDQSRTYDDNMLILPIPQTEIDVNTNLVQNAGY